MSRDDDCPNRGMQYTSELVGFIKEWEGCVLKCYQDPAGVWTIGYGCTGPDVDALATTPSPEITQIEADALLLDELDRVAAEIIRLVHVPLSQHQFDALVSFVFNVGAGAFAKSTMLRCINAVKFTDAALQFGRWVWAGGRILRGLERRRLAEQAVWVDAEYGVKP